MPNLYYRYSSVNSQVMFLLLLLSLFTIFGFSSIVKADEACDSEEECAELIEDTQEKLNELRDDLSKLNQSIDSLSSEISVNDNEVTRLRNEITGIRNNLDVVKESLRLKNEELSSKVSLRNSAIRTFSKRNEPDLLTRVLTSSMDNKINTYDEAANKELLRLISLINADIDSYEREKAELETYLVALKDSETRLESVLANLEVQKASVEGARSEVEEEANETEEFLGKLEKLQREIIAAKSGSGSSSIGDYSAVKWSVPDPDFSPAFAAFSYGAYTHYKGMSQYGAKGRAEDGQDYKDIIEFYYDEDVKKDDDIPSKIRVDGYGEMDFQKYLYGLAEMPSDWPKDALKAQAIAARTYAYRFVKAGKSICTTQSCQVFLKSKSDNPPSRWKDAVDDTEAMIISGGAHGMYSSTTGGYIEDVGWDTDGDWPGDAYEKKANSPWFYWAWYSKNYRFDSSTCGKDSPWLDSEEMADIINSWIVWKDGSDKHKAHISPITTDCWGGDPYSMDKMRDKADDISEGYKEVKSVDTDIGSNGQTKTVIFKTDKGTVEIPGDDFKEVFNLRAPGYISIRSRLYEVIKE
jgi:predicted  nucleic acid-binding Zn-ribbon protein